MLGLQPSGPGIRTRRWPLWPRRSPATPTRLGVLFHAMPERFPFDVFASDCTEKNTDIREAIHHDAYIRT